MARIRITAGSVSVEADLADSPTAEKLFAALPITGSGNRWGDEIYFSIPVEADLESDARAEMAVGEIAYWPPGSAFCIFWGPTPASSGSEPRAASPVNVLGQIDGDATAFGAVPNGAKVVIEAV
jgi:uncharacterized protein